MPIYAYRCSACGASKDVLQKLSDPVLTQCPECGEQAYAKQVTAAGFQLKGSGWYATDFRNGSAPAKPVAEPGAAAGPAAAPAGETAASGAVKSDKAASSEKAAVAAGPTPAAPTPAPAAGGSSGSAAR